MNVLFMTLANIETINGSGIYTDLMRQFVLNDHRVFVVSPLEKRQGGNTHVIDEEYCTILRVRTGNIKKSKLIEKALATMAIERQFQRAIEKYFGDVRFDLVLYSTPPITLTRVVEYIKNRDGARSYLLLKDIFPQNSVDLGMIPENSLLHKYFRYKEISLYKQADYIGCMSTANVNYIQQHNPYLNRVIIEVCPNSIEPVYIEMTESDVCRIREKYGIPTGKTVFIYGGNLGRAQGVDFLMKCIQINEDSEQAHVLIVGDGTEFNRLQSFIGNYHLSNTTLLKRIPKGDYDLLVNASDVGLVFLDSRFTIPNFPSRTLSYMQAAKPVLTFTDTNTDIGLVIESGNFGIWAGSGDLAAFQCHTALLCQDHQFRERMGANARKYLEGHYTVQQAYDTIMKHFQ